MAFEKGEIVMSIFSGITILIAIAFVVLAALYSKKNFGFWLFVGISALIFGVYGGGYGDGREKVKGQLAEISSLADSEAYDVLAQMKTPGGTIVAVLAYPKSKDVICVRSENELPQGTEKVMKQKIMGSAITAGDKKTEKMFGWRLTPIQSSAPLLELDESKPKE